MLLHYKHSLRLCSYVMYMFSSEILLCNDPSGANQWGQREFPVSLFHFMLLKLCECILKSVFLTFWNGVELIRFMLQIAPR